MRTDGKESRQFLYGDDCAECLIELSRNYDAIDRTKQLHITNFEWNTISDVASIINEIKSCQIIPNSAKDTVQLDKRNEPDPYILNFWKPKTSLKQGIKYLFDKF
jgi:nucleoside-diphosphate-sugar epimerase